MIDWKSFKTKIEENIDLAVSLRTEEQLDE